MNENLTVIIERAEHNYAAYIDGLDGITAIGNSISEIKTRIAEAIEIVKEACIEDGIEVPPQIKGEYTLSFKMDVQSLLTFYEGIFTKAGLSRITGINQKQLWHYAKGRSRPKPEQAIKIENALHKLGSELVSINI